MRRTGLEILGQLPWGTHFCQFYRTAEDLLEILVPYFRCGLEDHEYCSWVVSPPLTVDRAAAALREVVPDLDRRIESGQIEITDGLVAYTNPRGFDAEAVLKVWMEKEAAALRRGYAGFRLSGNVSGLRPESWQSFMEYESRVDRFIHHGRVLTACSYSLEDCGPAEVIDVTSHHAFALVRRSGAWTLIENQEYGHVREALARSSERFRVAADNLPQGLVIYDAQRRFKYLNKIALAWAGMTPGQMYGRRDEDVYPPEAVAGYLPALKAAYETRQPQRAEYELELPAGQQRYRASMSCTYTPVLDDEGELSQVVALVEDVTRRRASERALRESESLFRATFDQSPVGAIIAGLDRRIIQVNDEFCRFLGYSREELTRMTPQQVTHPDDIQGDQAEFLDLLSGKIQTIHRDKRYIRKDGQVAWGRLTVRQCRDAQGQPLYCLAKVQDITDRKRAEEELARAIQRLDAHMDNSPLAVVEFDPQFRVTRWSKEAQRLFGWSAAEVTGRAMTGFRWIHADDEDAVRQVAADMLSGAAPRNMCANRNYRKDGGIVYCEWYNSAIYDAQGRLASILSLVLDVTARNRAQQALQESEQHVRRVLDNLFAFVGVLTPEGVLVDVNRAPLEAAGLARQDVVGRAFEECYWWSYSPAAQQRVREAVNAAARGEASRFDVDVRMAGGTMMAIDFQIRPMRDASGRITHLIPSAVDITDRKRTQEALRRRAEEIQTLMDLVPVAIWVSEDPSCQKITGNRMANELYEATSGDNVSAGATAGEPAPPRRFFRQGKELRVEELPMQRAAAEGIEVRNAELDVLLPSGSRISILGSASPLRDSEGKVRGCLGAFLDLSARKRAEEERERLLIAAEEANRAKDNFIAALSHELRTPLTPVLAAASVMKDDPGLPEQFRDDVETIERNVGLEVHLIADLLDVTRISAGKLHLEKRPVDLVRVLQEAVRICSSELEAKSQRVSVELPRTGLICEGDEARLHQVFWNLLRNANKFTPEGGRIEVRVEAGDAAKISIADTGCGIAPERLGQLFRVFEQGSPEITRQFGGLGLGLAICKAVVELHGGRITAQSPGEGRGSTFTVELPAVSRPATARGNAPAIVRRKGPTPALKILLVEDHADTAKIMQRLLSREGHAVRMATSVAQALATARHDDFDVLVSDVGLPDGTGHDLLRRLLSEGKRVKAIALSGFGTPADIEASRHAGFAEHMVKPVSFEALHSALIRLAHGDGALAE